MGGDQIIGDLHRHDPRVITRHNGHDMPPKCAPLRVHPIMEGTLFSFALTGVAANAKWCRREEQIDLGIRRTRLLVRCLHPEGSSQFWQAKLFLARSFRHALLDSYGFGE
jgi:hypothetical protein